MEEIRISAQIIMNVVIIITDLDIHYSNKDISVPKPFADISGKPLLEWTIPSLQIPGRYFIGVPRKHIKYVNRIEEILRGLEIDYHIVILEDSLGSAHSVLMVTEVIKKRFGIANQSLIVAPYDQYFTWSSNKLLGFAQLGYDAIVTTYPFDDVEENSCCNHDTIRLNEKGIAEELVENFAVSYLALNDLHYFRSIAEFRDSALELMQGDVKWKNLAGVHNNLIKYGGTVAPLRLRMDDVVFLSSAHDIFANGSQIKHYCH